MTQSIAIIGGGIAGLAFAAYYKNLGGRVDIYERSEKSGREGLGFIMLENGMNALKKLGLESKVSNAGYPIDKCHIKDEFASSLISEKLTGSFGITRKAFVDVLMSQIPSDWLHFDHEFTNFEWSNDGSVKSAVFNDNVKVEADLFLGCDGGSSPVRQQIFPQATRAKVLVKELVSVIENPILVASLNKTFLKHSALSGGLAVGIVPADNQSVVWFIQFEISKYNALLNKLGTAAFVKKLLDGWPDPISQLTKETNFDKAYLTESSYLKPLQQFYLRNVVLLGDAAHALLPFTSQGVNSAIEDAVSLANALHGSRPGYLPMSLEHYSVMSKKVVSQYIDRGIQLQKEFLQPHQQHQKIPFAL